MRFRHGLLLFALAAPVVAQTASDEGWQIDSSRSRAEFWIRPLWVKRIEGVFPLLEGQVTRDAQTGLYRVEIDIDARAVQMGSRSQVTWAQSEQFFDVQRHPLIHFRGDPVPAERLFAPGLAMGEVTLRGITQPLRFQVQPPECTRPGLDCPMRASGEISRSAFGMDSHRLAMGDTVHLDFQLWLPPSDAPAESAP